MKAIMIASAGQAELVELERPAIGPDDILIRSYAVGICGSDVELYQGVRPAGFFRYPVIPGHEWAGEIASVGAQVHTLAPGDKVVVEGILSCGSCQNCRAGLTNLCEAGYDEIGFTRPGGLAEYVAVPARLAHALPAAASLNEAALLEPTAVVLHAFLRAQPCPGQTIAIIGDGTIGLLAVQLARLFSPSFIVLIGSRKERLELGQRLGAAYTINARHENPDEMVRALTGGHGVDLVFEGGNRPDGVAQAINLARRGGAVVLVGIAGAGARLYLESDVFVLKHLSVIGVFGAHTAAWTSAVQLFRSGLLNLGALITHRFPLADYQAALDTIMARRPDTVKVLLLHEPAQ